MSKQPFHCSFKGLFLHYSGDMEVIAAFVFEKYLLFPTPINVLGNAERDQTVASLCTTGFQLVVCGPSGGLHNPPKGPVAPST